MSEYGGSLPLILREVVRPALQMAGIWSEAREQIVLGTGCVESAYKYVTQMGGGPALGWWQVELATHDDMWTNFIHYRSTLRDKMRRLCEGFERHAAVVSFPQYAAAMCGVHYLRAKPALPTAGDAEAMAEYWRLHYNTLGGKGSVEVAVPHFQRAIEACK